MPNAFQGETFAEGGELYGSTTIHPAKTCRRGMGGTPLIELYVMNLVGNYITSLEMQGFSVTMCGLTEPLTRLWDAPVDTPALRWGR